MKILTNFLRRFGLGRFLIEHLYNQEQAHLSVRNHLESIDVLLKIQTLMHDGWLSFLYGDKQIKMYLPFAGQDIIQSHIVLGCTFFEEPLLRKARKFIPENACILDCGANIGNHTVFFSKICNARSVIAFEPQPLCADILMKNVTANGVAERVKLITKALGNKPGKMTVSRICVGNNGGTGFSYDDAGSFEVTTLDLSIAENVDFIKVDIEGGQLELLEGAQQLLSRHHPTIWIELNNDTTPDGYDFDHEVTKPTALLKSLGYQLSEKISETDYIFTYQA